MKAAEDLKEKVAAERRSKLLLEVKIRKEMAEAMFQQLLETEEAWRQVPLQPALRLKGFHVCKCTHVDVCTYRCIFRTFLLVLFREDRTAQFQNLRRKGKKEH